LFGAVTAAPPVMTVHVPVPTAGVLPASVAVAAQTVWSGPALAIVGTRSLVTVTVSLEGAQMPLVIVHTNIFAPIDNPVTWDEA